MIGMQRECDVESALHHVVRSFAGKRIEEISSQTKLWIACDHLLALRSRSKVVTIVAVWAISF